MLEKQISYDHRITEFGVIEIRRITRIVENGIEIAITYQGHSINPGDDYTNEDERAKILAKVIHTPEVVRTYEVQIAESEN